MAEGDLLAVEVAYALPERQLIMNVQVAEGTTVQQAVEQSGILAQFPSIDLSSAKLGVFGKLAANDRVLREGDRVEVYRALIADPKKVRKERAARQKAKQQL